jgi:hypothetical protein
LDFDNTGNDLAAQLCTGFNIAVPCALQVTSVFYAAELTGKTADEWVHKIYFDDEKLHGNVNALEVVPAGCTIDPDHTAEIAVLVEVGQVEVRQIDLLLDSGPASGNYFKLRYNAQDTSCLAWARKQQRLKRL